MRGWFNTLTMKYHCKYLNKSNSSEMHRDLVQSVIGKIFIAQKWDNDIFEAFE